MHAPAMVTSQWKLIALVQAVVIFNGLLAAKLPQDVQKCAYEDGDCIAQAMNHVVHRLYEGHPEMNLLSLDPVLVDGVTIAQGADNPVNINLRLTNAKVYGIKDGQVDKVVGFPKSFNNTMTEIYVTVPKLEIISQYKINGKVLILPIQGDGDANLTLINTKGKLQFRGRSVVVRDREYFQADQLKIRLDPARVYMDFSNLYNGDPLLGPATNAFLNENWSDIYQELKQSIEDTIGQVLITIMNNVFSNIRYSSLFIAE